MRYDYQVQTVSGSYFGKLEAVGSKLQAALTSEATTSLVEQGWELWQINTLEGDTMNGLILVFRRPKN